MNSRVFSIERDGLSQTPCPVCRLSGRPTRIKVNTVRAYRVERCKSCGLVYTTPRPTQEELASFYTSEYFDGGYDHFGYVDYGGESSAAANAARMWQLLQLWEPHISVVPHSVLDVGCATGDFAVSARNAGWEAYGVEMAEVARLQASDRGVRTYASLDEATGSFGLITMFHVLEHMIEPLSALDLARKLVDKRGLLVIELPQWGSLGRRLRGARWAEIRPPEHITFFDTRSLSIALARSGWKVDRSATIYEHLIDRSIEALYRRKSIRALACAVGALAVENAGLGKYLRVVASPAET